MRRRTAISTLALTSLAAPAWRPAGAQAALDRIAVVGPIAESQTNMFYAVKNGMFAKAGLDVVITSSSSGAAATTAVLTGSYDLGITNLLPIFAGHLRGLPIVTAVPGIINTFRNPYAQLQVASDSPYKTGADLNGKFGASPALGDINSLATRAWVDKNGGDSRTMKFVEIPNIALEAALTQHRVDAAMLQSPVLDASLEAGTTRTLGYAYGAIAPLFMGTGYVARRDWADQHADALRRFNRVLAEATVYVEAHPAETAPYVAEYTKITIENIAKMHRTVNGTAMDPALIQPVIDVAAKYGTIPRAFPAREIIWA